MFLYGLTLLLYLRLDLDETFLCETFLCETFLCEACFGDRLQNRLFVLLTYSQDLKALLHRFAVFRRQ